MKKTSSAPVRTLLVAVLLLAPCALQAATFLVANDATMVRASRAVITGTAGASHGRWAPGGWIETVTNINVEEVIKGPVGTSIDVASIDVVELGESARRAVARSHQQVAGFPVAIMPL